MYMCVYMCVFVISILWYLLSSLSLSLSPLFSILSNPPGLGGNNMVSPVTSHVLDTTAGTPGRGITITLYAGMGDVCTSLSLSLSLSPGLILSHRRFPLTMLLCSRRPNSVPASRITMAV
eukprot:TRINITY_DN3869_c0_g1_i8.p1 TRINITY_DN3869_c0_g1~~TRINITY_DN3869_c0_g1_i8.p1  ORF type:complete len:120 (-),score=10.44 TRINITY_DN3869_c0_g1_i8:380-739(-)